MIVQLSGVPSGLLSSVHHVRQGGLLVKIAVLIARLLLGLVFTFFGLNSFFHFLPDQIPPGDAGTMITLMIHYGWAMFLGSIYLVAGVLLLAGRYIGVALTLLGPPLVVILLFHLTLMPQMIGFVLFLVALEVFLIYAHWHHFDAVVKRR